MFEEFDDVFDFNNDGNIDTTERFIEMETIFGDLEETEEQGVDVEDIDDLDDEEYDDDFY